MISFPKLTQLYKIQKSHNTNKTEPFIPFNQDANCAELINIIKFSLPAMDDIYRNSQHFIISSIMNKAK